MVRLKLHLGVFLFGAIVHGAAAEEPAGEHLVQSYCAACHSSRYLERSSGYSRAEWATLISNMVDMSAASEDEVKLLDYLAVTYPPNSRRASTPVAGQASIEIESWTVPTLGQRPRDPVEDADGNIWWVGQWLDILGRIDPKTGEMTEFALPEGAKPHSVEIGPKGGVWYTGNKNATMGRLDPITGEIKEFPMPDPAALDPHTHVFDASGMLWFSLQHSNMIGRLDPATGDVKLVTAPTPRSRPYGVKIASDGNVWVACNGSNCLLKVDPETMEVEEIKLPDEGTHVRRLDIDDQGDIWWVNSGLGRLGRYSPAIEEIKEWPSPSGPKSHPYAIAIYKGAIWYNESGVRPDMLVRFDPNTETFQSWPMPSGEVYTGILRHMRVSHDGQSLLVHQTAGNRIMRVNIDE
ncbi:MAG: hypothetical protein JJ850_17605 [Kordiimonadaceae bacterium]|nr:hypothetical protein [Kordiimonadaceae bacterium]MBO6570439.1 hypothetical protein [Kordiimonadaceae bacterium]MBO6966442.1 hypothetical protein [Kordiimonadaceae bacterium]